MLVNVEFHFCDFCEVEKAKQIWWVFEGKYDGYLKKKVYDGYLRENMMGIWKKIWWVFESKYVGYLKENMMFF